MHQSIVAIGLYLPRDPERNLDLDRVRSTALAALPAGENFGRGDKDQIDRVVAAAIRAMLGPLECRSSVRIGAGRKVNSPGIFTGERLQLWSDGSVPAAVARNRGELKTHAMLLRATHRPVSWVEAIPNDGRKLPRNDGLGQRRRCGGWRMRVERSTCSGRLRFPNLRLRQNRTTLLPARPAVG